MKRKNVALTVAAEAHREASMAAALVKALRYRSIIIPLFFLCMLLVYMCKIRPDS